MFFNLSASWTRRLQVLGTVSLNFRLATLAAFYFIPQLPETCCKFRPINGCRVLLRFVELPRLQRSRVSISRLRDVEENDMRVKLRRCVAIHRTRAVVFKLSCNPFACSFGGKITPQPCLNKALDLAQGNRNTFPVSITDTLVAANKCG